MCEVSPFGNARRDCLRAHYQQVACEHNTRRHDDIVQIMHQAGFTEDELVTLYVEATMLDEGIPDDLLVSDLAALKTHRQRMVQHGSDCTCRACRGRYRK